MVDTTRSETRPSTLALGVLAGERGYLSNTSRNAFEPELVELAPPCPQIRASMFHFERLGQAHAFEPFLGAEMLHLYQEMRFKGVKLDHKFY